MKDPEETAKVGQGKRHDHNWQQHQEQGLGLGQFKRLLVIAEIAAESQAEQENQLGQNKKIFDIGKVSSR